MNWGLVVCAVTAAALLFTIAAVTTVHIRRRRRDNDYRRTAVYIALYRQRRTTASDDEVNQWVATRLPERRLELLIHAGIPLAEATSPQVAALSDEALEVMTALQQGPRPMPEVWAYF